MTFRNQLRLFCLSGLLLAAPAALHAQRGGGMGGGGMGGGMGRGGGMDIPGRGPVGDVPRGNGGNPEGGNARGGVQLGPTGRWWDDKKMAKSLGLNSDQQKRMDAVFGQNRDALISRLDNLQRAESRLEALTHVSKPSETALFTEIDHVEQARADLEKAKTHMLLQLRDEMTPDQISKLDDHR